MLISNPSGKHQEARKESYPAEDKAYKDLVKKEREKVKKIDQLIKNAKREYPFLYEVLQSKSREEILKKQKVEILSKMTFRLEPKRKKDGDIAYYIKTIIDGLKTIEDNLSKD